VLAENVSGILVYIVQARLVNQRIYLQIRNDVVYIEAIKTAVAKAVACQFIATQVEKLGRTHER